MPEINSYSPCVRLINHPYTFGIWAKRGDQLLVWVLILKFQWQVLPNDPVRLIVPMDLWVFTAWLTCICPHTEMSMLYTCTAVTNEDGCRNTHAQLRVPVQERFCKTGSLIDLSHYHLSSLLASIAGNGFAQSWPLGMILPIKIAIIDLKALICTVFPVSFQVRLALVIRTWFIHSTITVMFSALKTLVLHFTTSLHKQFSH